MTPDASVTTEQQAEDLISVSRVHSTPEPEELAAIVAAVEMTWPRPVQVNPYEEIPRWRFSGRWWSKPLPIRRDRP